jgi:hypothetical protein
MGMLQRDSLACRPFGMVLRHEIEDAVIAAAARLEQQVHCYWQLYTIPKNVVLIR